MPDWFYFSINLFWSLWWMCLKLTIVLNLFYSVGNIKRSCHFCPIYDSYITSVYDSPRKISLRKQITTTVIFQFHWVYWCNIDNLLDWLSPHLFVQRQILTISTNTILGIKYSILSLTLYIFSNTQIYQSMIRHVLIKDTIVINWCILLQFLHVLHTLIFSNNS